MTENETISWIFLATIMASQAEPATALAISRIADRINHTLPTQQELNFSFSWLVKKGLIVKIGKKYSATPAGTTIYEIASKNRADLQETWKNLEENVRIFA